MQQTLHQAREQGPATEDVGRLASHVDVVLGGDDIAEYTPLLAAALSDNPSTTFDVYIGCEAEPPSPAALCRWRDELPFQPGYLDRVAVYQSRDPTEGYTRVNPRLFLVLPWSSTTEPAGFEGIAEVIWRFELMEGDAAPLGAWYSAGGAGIALRFLPGCTQSYRAQVMAELERWERETGRMVWLVQMD